MADNAFGPFFRLGTEHIFTGYDHLVFLFGLLAGCTRWRSVLWLLTCFTLGHSLTLALATLDVVSVPARIGEPLIALTLVLVGAENFWQRDRPSEAEPRGRYPVTVLFGLVHGFGFASVLRELGVGRTDGGIAQPLLGFNLGVEAGQIAFAALVLPAFWWLRRRPGFVRRGLPALSLLMAGIGLYWLAERLMNPAT